MLTQNHFFFFFPTLLLLCYWPHHSCPSLHFWKKLNFLSYQCNMNFWTGDTGNGRFCCQCSYSLYCIISFLNLSVASLPLWVGDKTTMNNCKIQLCCLLYTYCVLWAGQKLLQTTEHSISQVSWLIQVSSC